MTKRLLGVLSFAAVSILALSQAAKATPIAPGDDPAFVETVTNSCPANCGSVALATDPFPGGLTTVRYTFNSTIPSVVAGDVKIQEFGSSTIGDLIRFENISGSAVAFIYSTDIAGGLAADVGLPASFQTNFVTISENSAGFAIITPSSGQPGYCASCSATIIYGLTSTDVVPEPSTLLLIGSGLLAAAFVVRRRGKEATG